MENLTQITYQRLQDLEYRVEKLRIFAQSLSSVDVSSLNTEILTVKARIESLTSTIRSMQGVDTSVDSRLSQLESTYAIHDSEIATLTNLVANIECKCDEQYNYSQEIQALQNKDKDLEEKFEIANTTAVKADNRAVILEGNVDNLRADVNSIFTEVYKIPKLQTADKEHETRLTALETTDNTHSEQLTNLTNSVNNLSSKVDESSSKIDSYDSAISQMQSSVEISNTKISEFETNLNSANSNLNTLQTNVSNIQTEITDLKQANTKFQTQISGFESEINSNSIRIDYCETQNNNRISEIESLQLLTSVQSTSVSQLRERIDNLISRISTIEKTHINDVTNELDFILSGSYITNDDIAEILEGSYIKGE